ncbi:muts domain V-domain-containing protein [Cokeromyces recurvatus]|uniref:muts domain V-domain-containing protein n=1 Tax=Cokeromyces recurvatus TaxID=90255 RepID=UPI00221FF296|nr:muts domain V-domain-containing protein [Cokeromyces recurvatus]KAI7903334.1 muts domain V-domain-containing protein [Cokeromyces recurvatus]
MTPLEKQVVELKAKYPDCLLLIEVGYKFRFFGEDAKIASRILHIANFIDRNFYVASIPVHRLNYHVQKLVDAGYKVGIVRQTETASLKAIGSNRNQPFQRELQQMITKGTIIDDILINSSTTGHLLCLIEQKRGGHGSDERVYIGLISIHPATGDIIYDAFEDTFMRTELETRLLHIEPSEIICPPVMSKATEKMLMLRSSYHVRMERMKNTFCNDYNAALTYVTDFYVEQRQQQQQQQQSIKMSKVMSLPDIIVQTLACLIQYLDEFKLTNILKEIKYFHHFVTKNHMLLNGTTLVNLEIYRNNTDFTTKGSLFSILDHTKTKFGQRLLRKWIGKPLIDINKINERVYAIEELKTTSNPKKGLLLSLLKQIPDIEKGICRIHYGKTSPKELLQILEAFNKISSTFVPLYESRFESDLLNTLFDTLPIIHDDIVSFKSAIYTTTTKVTEFFKSDEKWPEIQREKKNINYVQCLLEEHLEKVQKETQLGHLGVKYVTVAGQDYLLEVANTKLRYVPQDWIKISGTKAVSRFQDKYIIEQLREKERHEDLLIMYAEKAYKEFLMEISEKYEKLRDIVSCLAQLDCLLSLTVTASQPNYVKPIFDERVRIDVVEGRHPMAEKQNQTSSYIANDIHFNEPQTTMVLTGPNMGGKSSYIRQIALIVLMAQLGSYVPAQSARMGLFDAIYTRMGATDQMMRGQSTFMVEMQETSEIMKLATSRSLVILDELGRGTSTHDGQAIAHAVLDHFVKEIRCVTLFVTHYPSLGKLFGDEFPNQVRNCYMDYIEEQNQEAGISNIVFLYKLANGIAMSSYGMNVARLAGIPLPIIKRAKEIAEKKKRQMEG